MATKDQSISWPARASTFGQSWTGGAGKTTEYTRTQVATRTRTGTRLPNYKKVIAAGENATTPLSAVSDTIRSTPWNCYFRVLWGNDPGYWHIRKGTGDICVANQINSYTNPNEFAPAKDTTVADARAYAKFLAKIRKAQVQLSGPTFLGELREAVHMIKSPAEALRKGMSDYLAALRKRKSRDPFGWTKAIGGTWLEYSFGWLPFLHDIEDGYLAYKRLGEERRNQLVSAGAENLFDRLKEIDAPKYATLRASQINMGNGVGGTTAVLWFIEKHTVRYKGAVSAQARVAVWDDLSLFGFRMDEFLPTAWELLPWSFLADYFTNIGDIVNASVTDTSKVRYVNRSTIRKSHIYGTMAGNGAYTAQLVGGQPATTWTGYSEPGSWEVSRRTVDRQKGVGLQQTQFLFDTGLSDGQLGNIAALLSQALGLHPQSGAPRGFNDPRRRRP